MRCCRWPTSAEGVQRRMRPTHNGVPRFVILHHQRFAKKRIRVQFQPVVSQFLPRAIGRSDGHFGRSHGLVKDPRMVGVHREGKVPERWLRRHWTTAKTNAKGQEREEIGR